VELAISIRSYTAGIFNAVHRNPPKVEVREPASLPLRKVEGALGCVSSPAKMYNRDVEVKEW
jgi:hypothetical protein